MRFLLLLLVSVPTIAALSPKVENGCYFLYNAKTNKAELGPSGKRCTDRMPACSTFKIPLALIAIEKGLITHENTSFKYDGTDYGMAGWNRDQTAASWIKESAVWVSQEITRKLGKETVEKYLKDFGYGTADLSGGLETAWLTLGTPGKPVTKTTMLISPEEQLRFLTKLWKNELPVSQKATDLVKKLLFVEKTPKLYTLFGKTGSGFLGTKGETRLGWFVGFVEGPAEEYVTVMAFQSKKLEDGNRFAGMEARERTKFFLSENGKY